MYLIDKKRKAFLLNIKKILEKLNKNNMIFIDN